MLVIALSAKLTTICEMITCATLTVWLDSMRMPINLLVTGVLMTVSPAIVTKPVKLATQWKITDS